MSNWQEPILHEGCSLFVVEGADVPSTGSSQETFMGCDVGQKEKD